MKILVHVCCAPDLIATYYHLKGHDLTLFFFNPNIHPPKEYEKRLENVEFLAERWKLPLVKGDYDVKKWYEVVKEYKDLGEGSRRCYECIEYRLEETAKLGKKGFDAITTTLTASPMKNLSWIEEIGKNIGRKYGVRFYFADFKKKGGQDFSIKVSRELGIYRQNYCGCVFSKREAEENRRKSRMKRQKALERILKSYGIQEEYELDPEVLEIDEKLLKFGEEFLKELVLTVRPRRVLLPEKLWPNKRNLKIGRYKVKIVRRNEDD